MTTELKAKWLEALQSGKYAKGEKFLRIKWDDEPVERFCCLGVLCDITVPERWEKKGVAFSVDNTTAALPTVVRESVGLPVDVMWQLVRINDDTDTFDKVIEYIKEKL